MNRLFITILGFFLLPATIANAQKERIKTRERTHDISWKEVQDADILWSKIVMREIDLAYSYNTPLQEMKDSMGKKLTINQLFGKLAKDHQITISNLAGDTTVVQDSTLALLAKEIKRNDSTCVNKYVVVEEWEFNRKKGKMEVHILWIGPYIPHYGKPIKNTGNTRIPCESALYQPLFAVKYNDLRRVFEQYKIETNGGDKKETMNVKDYFEGRQFKSKITCVEGSPDTGKEIFNKKKDGWVY